MARMTPRQIERAFAQQPDAEDDNILVFEPADESCFPDEKAERESMEDNWYERNLAWEPDGNADNFDDSDFE